MKSLLFLLALFSLHLSLAQGPDSAKVEQLYAAFNEHLQLTPDQQPAVLDILHQTAGSLREINGMKQTDVAAFRQAKKQIHQQMRTEMATILNSEQMSTFEAAMQQRRNARTGGKRGQSSPSTTQSRSDTQLAPNNQLGVDALSRSLDFLFDEVLQPTVRKKVKGH